MRDLVTERVEFESPRLVEGLDTRGGAQATDAANCDGTFLGVGVPCDPLTCEDAGGGYCGDGNLDPGEECDDGNNVNGDGCDENCRIEAVVPAMSTWGVVVVALLLSMLGTIVLLRSRRSAPGN